MAFNRRKFQKLIEEEKNNTESFVDEFEDDFADDFANDFAEEPEPVTEFVPEPQEEPQQAEEEAVEETNDEPVIEEPVIEAPVMEEPEPAKEEEPVVPIIAEPIVEEKAAEEVYDPHKMWQDMAAMAIKAKECIVAGAFFRANDIITAMRSVLVEMMCRANGITENFNENADNLSDECKQDIYTSYASALNAQALSDAVTHIMAVTYKYI